MTLQPDSQQRDDVSPVPSRPIHVPNNAEFAAQPDELTPPSFRDYLDIVYRRGWWMLLTFAIMVMIGVLWTLTQQRLYTSTADIIVTQSSSSSGGASSGLQILGDLAGLTQARSIATQMAVLQSPTLEETALNKLSPEQRKLLGKYSFAVTNQKDTDIISVTVTAPYPAAAAALANNLVETYKERDLQENREATQTASKYILDELHRVGKELHSARRKLADYKAKTHIYVLGTPGGGGAGGGSNILEPGFQQRVEYAATLESVQQQATRDLQETQRTINSVAAALSHTEKQIVAQTDEAKSPLRTQIETQIETLEETRAGLLQSYIATAPEVKALDEQIRAARQRLSLHLVEEIAGHRRIPNPLQQTLQGQYVSARVQADALRTRIAALQRQLDVLHQSLAKLPAQDLQIAELIGTVAQLQSTYALLSEKYQELRISEEARLTNVRLVNAAWPNSKPVSPNIPRNIVLFVFLGMMCAIGLAKLLEAMDDRIHSTATIEHLSRRPVLALVPFVTDTPQLIHLAGHRSSMLESIRLLRSNLLFANMDHPTRVIGITSAGQGEGKSTSVINLAVAFAMDGKRVIIVDADLRKPSLHRYFELPRGFGLTNVATGQVSLADAIQTTTIEGVSLLGAGPLRPNPPEVLNSKGVRAIFTRLAEEYDLVIVDMPPTAGLSDSSVLSTIIDGMLIVIAENQTHFGQLQIALRALEGVDSPILGFIYNKFNAERSHYGYYYYYYYYGEGGPAEAGKSGRHKKRLRHQDSDPLPGATDKLEHNDKSQS